MTSIPASSAPAVLRNTANPAPVQPLASIRRTTSIDVEWLDGILGARRLHGVSRDYLRSATGAGSIAAQAEMCADLDYERKITAISAMPTPARMAELVGQRGGGHLRMLMAQNMPELIASGEPLYLLLDDISGISLISSWAWAMWNPNWKEELLPTIAGGSFQKMMEERAGVCWGLQIGHSGLDPEQGSAGQESADGKELRNPADPDGWHIFPEIAGISMRRARRIDVWRDADSGLIHIDSAFQDSAPLPETDGVSGRRAALHEYRLVATVDPISMELLSLEPEGRVLPFHECPGAIINAKKLVGTPLNEIRNAVLAQLRGPAGCTHLNDALRALAEVPKLLEKLSAA